MAVLVKRNFIGGINQQSDPSRVAEDQGQLYLLMNGRIRRNIVSPIRRPKDISSGLPSSVIMQGAYAVNSLQIVFAGGRAFYKNFDPEGPAWQPVPGFFMSPTADRIYMEKVPSSHNNFSRTAVSASDAKAGVRLAAPIRGMPQCAVCCDGINQPWAIFPDATARVLKKYSEWNTTDREYVPIGILPTKIGSKLYMVGKDKYGYYNQIFHSVSGRYLDFVIPVSETGDRIDSSEEEGGAPRMSYSCDFGNLTALARIPAGNNAFYASTVKDSYMILPDFTPENMIYGEPTFSNQFLFSIGALNENCVVDKLGDTALIHYSGIRDFNAILTLLNEGRNSPFSKQIDELIADITQTYGAATTYDNYTVFAVQTRYGAALIWYDTLMQQFASIDQIEGIGAIKQFSVVQTKTARKLLFITQNNKLYEWEGDTTPAVCKVYIKDFLPENPTSQHVINQVGLEFGRVASPGYVQIQTITDGILYDTAAFALSETEGLVDGEFDSIPYPLSNNRVGTTVIADFKSNAAAGYKVGALVEWNADTSLLEMSVKTQEVTSARPNRVASSVLTQITPEIITFIGNDGVDSPLRLRIANGLKEWNPDYVIGLGDHALSDGTDEEVTDKLSAYWNRFKAAGRFFAVPGDRDLNTRNGEPFFQYMLQSPTRYFKLATGYADIYMMNSGYNESGTLIEPDSQDAAALKDCTQYKWLKARLAESVAARRHAIVVWHHAPYSSATGYGGGKAALRDVPVRDWGASAVICGHPKLYERLIVDDIVHYAIGTGGDTVDSTATAIAQSYKLITGTYGFLKAVVYPLTIEFQFVDEDGVIYDSFVIHK